MTFRGTIHNGKVILDGPTSLPNGTEVEVTPSRKTRTARKASPSRPRRSARTGSARRARSVLDALRPFIGTLKGLPRDAAANVDHYLYGAPRRS